VFTYFHEKAARGYFGTGDIFASVLTGNLVRGATPEAAARKAADFALQCIKTTLAAPDGRWYGTCYEQELWRLGSPDSQ
jgi:pyridoxine kinase